MFPIHTKNRTIGLLGGSFNPAHAGHVHISLHALKKLKLDQVWWLVTPHNPLKSKTSLAAYDKRMASAQKMAQHPRIYVSAFEACHRTRYSFQTIALIKKKYPGTRFVWLMGADNLVSFHRWQRWKQIMHMLPVAVFDRAPFSYTALTSKAAAYGRKISLNNNRISLPPLSFVRMRRDASSSTSIRKNLEKKAF